MGKQEEGRALRSSKRKGTDVEKSVAAPKDDPKPKRAKKQPAAAAAAAVASPKRAAPKDKQKQPKPRQAAAVSKRKQQQPKKKQQKQQQEQQEEEEEEEEEEEAPAPKKQPRKAAAPKRRSRQPEPEPEEQEEEEDDDEEEEGSEEANEEGASTFNAFMEEVHAKERELGKHCVIMEQVETDEDETTLEQLRALKRVFVPQGVQEAFIEIWTELEEVEDEFQDSEDGEPDILEAIMAAILGQSNLMDARHAGMMHGIIEGYLRTVDRAIENKKWEIAFCEWAATLMACLKQPHWYEDTEAPEQVQVLYERMRQQWLKLRKRRHQDLGGLVAEGGRSPIAEFDAYLQKLADEIQAMDIVVHDVL